MENNNKNLKNKIDLPKTFDSFSRRGMETDRSVFASYLQFSGGKAEISRMSNRFFFA